MSDTTTLNLFDDEISGAQAKGDDDKREKSRTAYRTISEVGDELGLAPHVLRFWESKFHEVQPIKQSGGRRYYRPEDMAVLSKIRTLLYDEGYTIRGVQAFLKKSDDQPAVPPVESLPKRKPKQTLDVRGLLQELRGLRALLE